MKSGGRSFQRSGPNAVKDFELKIVLVLGTSTLSPRNDLRAQQFCDVLEGTKQITNVGWAFVMDCFIYKQTRMKTIR